MISKVSASSLVKVLAWACAALLLTGIPAAFAVPVSYSFTTAAGPVISSAAFASILDGAFGATDIASGTFMYDPASPVTGTGSAGATIYGFAPPPTPLSFFSLAGTAGSHAFSDPKGYVTVSNDKPVGAFPQADAIQVYSDSAIPNSGAAYNFSGFSIAGYIAVNLRMFWIEGQNGITDFLTDQSLPAALPSFGGVLAIDFVPINNPTLPASNFVFFNGLTVTPTTAVPEPGTILLLLAGLGLVGLASRKRDRM